MLIETPRLAIRDWRDADRRPFAAMNADPDVMRFFPSVLNAAESDAMLQRIQTSFAKHGFGLWAVSLRTTDEFAGFIGLSVPAFQGRFTPCVEIGWRLAARFWNQGFATEGATHVLQIGHEQLGLAEIVSFTSIHNLPSRRVMEKIGMLRSADDDFDHPNLPPGHFLKRHVLYRSRSSIQVGA